MVPTKIEWEEIRVKYEAGEHLGDVASQYLIPQCNISAQAKRKNWGERPNAILKIISQLDAIKPKIDNSTIKEVQPLLSSATSKKIATRIYKSPIEGTLGELDVAIKEKSKILLERFIEITNIAINQTVTLMEKNPEGLHISSDGVSGKKYSRNTQFINDLIPLFLALKSYVTIDDNKIINFNTQINGQNLKELVINANPLIASKQYQDFIK